MTHYDYVYIFIGGAFSGKYIGIIPSIVVSGAILYVGNPSLFTYDNLHNVKTVIIDIIKEIKN